MAVASPALHRLASQRNYPELLERFASHPEDIVWTDRYGNTTLHVLCQAQQRDDMLLPAIRAIVNAKPELIQQANLAGWTPMHHAASKRLSTRPSSLHSDMLLFLIEKCPSAVSKVNLSGFKRMTPFHIACEANLDISILKRMLRVNPLLATKPCVENEAYAMSENPIQLLWKASSNVVLQQRGDGVASTLWADSSAFVQITDKIALLLLTAYHGQVVDSSANRYLLHAACSQRVPRAFISYILSHEDIRQQARVVDERGNLPLHYAVDSASVDSQLYTHFLFNYLLEVYPGAASVVDSHGRLPLYAALRDSHMTWHKGGIRELVYAYPMALVSRDEASQLYPFMASAQKAISSRLHLSTLYELLRAAPDMVKVDNND